MVSEKGSPLVTKLGDRLERYLSENRFNNQGRFKQFVIETLSERLNQSTRTTRYWFSPIVTKILRVYPYFAFHYLFERVVSNNPDCQKIWRQATAFNTHDGPFDILKMGFFTPLSKAKKNSIDKVATPVYKLSWKANFNSYNSSSTLYYLLETRTKLATVKSDQKTPLPRYYQAKSHA